MMLAQGVHDTQPQISNTNLLLGNSHHYPSIIFDPDISSLLNKEPSARTVGCNHVASHPMVCEDGMNNRISVLRVKYSVSNQW